MKILVRQGKSEDIGFCLSTWMKTFPMFGDREARKAHMKRALLRGTLKVACSDEDQDTLVGWALHEEGDLLWVYVSNDFRKLGISKRLKEEHTDGS